MYSLTVEGVIPRGRPRPRPDPDAQLPFDVLDPLEDALTGRPTLPMRQPLQKPMPGAAALLEIVQGELLEQRPKVGRNRAASESARLAVEWALRRTRSGCLPRSCTCVSQTRVRVGREGAGDQDELGSWQTLLALGGHVHDGGRQRERRVTLIVLLRREPQHCSCCQGAA